MYMVCVLTLVFVEHTFCQGFQYRIMVYFQKSFIFDFLEMLSTKIQLFEIKSSYVGFLYCAAILCLLQGLVLTLRYVNTFKISNELSSNLVPSKVISTVIR